MRHKNFTDEKKRELKKEVAKLLNKMQMRTVLNDKTYEAIDNQIDEVVRKFYTYNDDIHAKNVK